MKISIVMATLNDGDALKASLDSIFRQTYKDVEVLIVDGLSKDGTANLLSSISDNKLKWWISEIDRGIYDAWNKALKHITGDWILFLGSGDELWNDSVLERFVSITKGIDRKYNVVYGQVALIDENRNVTSFVGDYWESSKKDFRYGGKMLPHQGIFHKRDVFINGKKFNSNYEISGDYEFLLRILKKEDAFFIHSFVVSRMLSGGISGGFNNAKLLKEIMMARRDNGYSENFYTLLLRLRYFCRGFLISIIGEEKVIKINNLIKFYLTKKNH